MELKVDLDLYLLVHKDVKLIHNGIERLGEFFMPSPMVSQLIHNGIERNVPPDRLIMPHIPKLIHNGIERIEIEEGYRKNSTESLIHNGIESYSCNI